MAQQKCDVCGGKLSKPILFMGNETMFCLGKCHQNKKE